jgi:nucleoside-diphosphate kinase
MKMTKAQAEGFYEVHKERPFYEELTTFMSSGPCMVLALEKDNAVSAWRETIGATNPDEAAEGTIRKDFATNLGENAVHGSDSDENAQKEIGFFFTESELIANQ